MHFITWLYANIHITRFKSIANGIALAIISAVSYQNFWIFKYHVLIGFFISLAIWKTVRHN